jgi:uncharacterized hydrophobic protein (TIGR00271 family)
VQRSNLNDLAKMRDAVFFEGPDRRFKFSRFWTLLLLAAVIASSGIIGDSEATVIGAMIVAPLRTPILGLMLSIVLGDRRNLVTSVSLVVGGAMATIGVGYSMAALSFNTSQIITSSQINTWSQARLIDLVAALAVGVVGSIALVRRDISDTLPGVAIAISLVPPLTVVGMSLQVGLGSNAWGAFLLFATNVSAILGVGAVTMALYGVRRLGGRGVRLDDSAETSREVNQREAYIVIGLSVVVIFVVLLGRTLSAVETTQSESTVDRVSQEWAEGTDWEVVLVSTSNDGTIVVRFEGPPPAPPTDDLRSDFDEAGVDTTRLRLNFVPRETVTFESEE